MKHKKKILKEYFEAIYEGAKTFEIRKEDDCTYAVGDLIQLNEVTEIPTFKDDEISGSEIVETGESVLVEITYRLSHEDFPEGIMPHYVVLGIKLRSDEE